MTHSRSLSVVASLVFLLFCISNGFLCFLCLPRFVCGAFQCRSLLVFSARLPTCLVCSCGLTPSLLRDCLLSPFCFTCILLSYQLFLVQPWCRAQLSPFLLCFAWNYCIVLFICCSCHCFLSSFFRFLSLRFAPVCTASLWTERRRNSEVTWWLLKQWPPDNKVHLIKVRDGEKWSLHYVRLKPAVYLALN